MEKTIQHEKYGTIIYTESFWTSKKSISINGTPLFALNKNTFQYQNGEYTETVIIKGNLLKGVIMIIGGEEITLSEKTTWYEYTLSALIFAFTLVWGNSVQLCSIIPIVGGALGGFISALFACLNIMLMKKTNKIYFKLLIFLGFFILNFLLCFLLAYAFISALQ